MEWSWVPKNVGSNPVDLGMWATEVFQRGGGSGGRLCTSSRRLGEVPIESKTNRLVRFGK